MFFTKKKKMNNPVPRPLPQTKSVMIEKQQLYNFEFEGSDILTNLLLSEKNDEITHDKSDFLMNIGRPNPLLKLLSIPEDDTSEGKLIISRNETKPDIVVIIRGHIREAFFNNKLRKFVMFLKEIYNIRIFIHTWDEINGSKSWKDSNKQNTTKVTIKMIQEYFTNIHISRILIENDQNLISTLIGGTEGLLCKSLCPVIAWKNMWVGKYNLINEMNNMVNPDSTVLEFRFDLFCKSNSCHTLFTEKIVYEKCSILQTCFEEYKPQCLASTFTYGLDNLMIGSFHQLFTLFCLFHTDLDNIMAKYPNIQSQEFLVLQTINDIFTNKPELKCPSLAQALKKPD